MEALTMGKARSASTVARATKGRKVREMPLRAAKSSLCFARILATRLMSTRCTVVTCAETRLLITMCSAILIRMLLMGSTRFLAVGCAWPIGADGAGGGGAWTGGAAGAAADLLMCASTSSL